MILKRRSIFKKQTLKKNFAHKKSCFDSIYPVESAKIAFYVQFQKARFCRMKSMNLKEKNFVKSTILKNDFFVLSVFESRFLQRVRFRIEYFMTSQISNVLLLHRFGKLSCVHQSRARFGNVFFCMVWVRLTKLFC